MKGILCLLAILFCLQLNGQNARKTNFTTPLKARASFTDPAIKDYSPYLLHLDQNPIPFAAYGNKKEIRQQERLRVNAKEMSYKRTRGGAPNPIVVAEWQGNLGSGTPFDNEVAISNDGTIISAINSNINVYDTSGNLQFGKSINSMDSVLNVFTFISDPRLLYDPNLDRFILTCFSGNFSAASKIIIGFSTTNNPADDWNFYVLDGDPFGDSVWSDYPIIAMNDKDFFMTWNHIKDNLGWQNGFEQSVIYQISKEEGFNGSSLNYTIWDSLNWEGVPYRNICPARYNQEDMPDDMYFLSVRNVDMTNDSIFVMHIDDAYNSGNASFSQRVLKSPNPYGMPPNIEMDNDNRLMTNDGRVLSALFENDRLHFGANSVHPTYANAGLFLGEIGKVSSDNPTIEADVMSLPNQEFGYPSMTWAGTGIEKKIMYTFGHCYTDSFPGFSVLYKNKDGYSDIIPIKNGVNSINRLIGPNERWGDYSGIQKMYNNPNVIVAVGSVGEEGGTRAKVAIIRHEDSSITVSQPIITKSYPNPTSNRYTTQFYLDADQDLSFLLYDLKGRRIARLLEANAKKGNNEFSFNLSELPRGQYVFVINGKDGRFITERVVVEK